MVLNHLILSFLISVCFASINDYDLESFTDMCYRNVTSSLYYLPRNNNKDLVSTKDDKIRNLGTYHYIIVGAGSAGTLLANRLSEDPDRKVLLLEAGGQENDFSDIPGMTQFLVSSDMDWGYRSVPQKNGCFGQLLNKCVTPRGKVLGGSSTINAKMYVRGNKEDYNGWAKMGNQGWSFDEILPYFLKTENNTIPGLDKGYHKTGGLLDVSYIDSTIFRDVYFNGMKELGYNETDINGANQIGVAQTPFTLNRDRISSGGRSFIDPIINERDNLKVLLKAFVTKIIIDRSTKTATGVQFVQNKKTFAVRASLDVILSAGSFNTPQILMLSGIGPEKHLRDVDVETVHNLPAVGQNLQDHAEYIGLLIRTNQTLFDAKFRQYAKTYFVNRTRPWSSPYGTEAMGFFNVYDKSSTVPDIQHILTVPPSAHAQAELSPSIPLILDPLRDLLLQVILIRPKSRGSVTLQSNDPIDFPNIDFNFYSDPEDEDLSTLTDGVMETLKLLKTDAFRSVNADVRPLPTPFCELKYRRLSRGYFKCAIKKSSRTAYHPCGTCRMGNDIKDSVVSPDLKVHGINKLRIVDASVIPESPSGNLNAPVYMITEKAADIIKEQNSMN